MRTIERTGQFKKDYKRECKGQHRLTVENDLLAVLSQLIEDKPLAAKYRDHPLTNNWADHRVCHIKTDIWFTAHPRSYGKSLPLKCHKALNRILQIMKELGLTPGHRVGVVRSLTPESLAMEAFLAGP